MRNIMTDWEGIKNRYLSSDISLSKLAEDEGTNYATLCRRAKKENWSELKKIRMESGSEGRMERVTAKLLEKMELAIDRSAEMDSKEIKAMTGALKELREMRREGSEDYGSGRRLEVCFLGETEELSR